MLPDRAKSMRALAGAMWAPTFFDARFEPVDQLQDHLGREMMAHQAVAAVPVDLDGDGIAGGQAVPRGQRVDDVQALSLIHI